MAKKKLATILSTTALIGSLFSSSAFAAENPKSSLDNGKGTLVGLGDSITFGYNLGTTNNQPSKLAFPYLIGEAVDENVLDLGVPGWTTTDLLNALNTNSTYQASVKLADKITIDIGSNDLLHLLASTNGNITPQAVAPILANLHTIIAKVRSLAPHAEIVVYDIYNPFQVDDVQNHVLADKLLPEINQEIAGVVASFHDWEIVLANAYGAFGQNQATYVRQGDIHPTVAGQEKLAEIGFADFVAISKGWLEANGHWYYYTAKGKATGWQQICGHWYYFDNNGWMKTGWQMICGHWYYFDNNGWMKAGWQQISGHWYYFDSNGWMKTGWQQISGHWYDFDRNGWMKTGWQKISGHWYDLDSNGWMKTGWQKISGHWYDFDSNGWMKTGWQKISGHWYDLDSNGWMKTGWQTINGKHYYFYSNGAMAVNSTIVGKKIDSNGAEV